MINPYQIRSIEGDRVTSPYVFLIYIGNRDISDKWKDSQCMFRLRLSNLRTCISYLLDDDVTCTTDNSQTFTLDHSAGTGSDQAFVGGDFYT